MLSTVDGPKIIAHSHPYTTYASAHFLAPGGLNQGGQQVTEAPSGGTGISGGGGAHTHGLSIGTQHTHSPSPGSHSMSLNPQPHNHPFSSSLDFGIQYVDMIVATKD